MRRVALAILIACLLAGAASVMALRVTMVWPFVLSGATDVVVISRGLDSFTISYRAEGRPDAWREDIAYQLAQSGWRRRDYSFGYTKRFTATWYSRTIDFGPLSILESAIVGGDPNDPQLVHLRTHREIHLSFWPSL